jgi:hypothetical protein
MTGNLGLDEKTGNQIEPRVLNAPAQRALAEAEARRAEKQEAARPAEIGGRDGPDPIRYGDWEVKGIASDF